MFGVAADVAAGSVASIASNLASKNRPQVQQQQQQHSSPSSPLHQSSDTESAASPIPRETWTPKMIPADPPLAKFLVTKVRSFRPAYQRIIALHRHHLMTIETENFSETNRYPYASILRVTALVREEDALLLELAAPSGERIKFRCSRRPALLTEIHRRKFCSDAEMVRAARGRTELPTAVHDAAVAVIGPDGRAVPTFVCERQRRMGGRVPCQLVVLPHAVREVTIDGMHVLQEYKYIHIDSVGFLSDNPHGIILYVTGRGRLFFLSPSPRSNIRSDLASALKDATESLGTSFVIGPGIPWTDWIQRRSALGQDAGTPVCVHRVTKCTPRHPDLPALRREVAVTPTHVVERDPGAVAAVSCRSLTDLHALVRLDDTSLRLEYTDGQARTYASPARDALACSILDCCLSVGHKDVAVTEGGADGRRLLPRGQGNGETGKSKGRLGELFFGPDTVEAWHLKRAGTVAVARMQLGSWAVDAETCCDVAEACADFNANVPLTGISHSTDKRTTVGALYPLCRMVMTLIDNPNKEAATDVAARSASEQIVATLLQSIFRIVQCPAGFMAVAEMSYYCPLFSSLLKMWDSFALYWAVRTLGAVMKCGEPRNREQEFVNKQLLLSSPLEILHALVALLIGQGGAASSWSVSVGNAALPPSGERSSDLLLMAASEVIESILCGCYDTTAPPHFDVMITSLSSGYGALMEMLRSTCAVVVENAALLLQIISRHRPEVAVQVREAALSSATLLRHLYLSIFSPADSQRFLSRFLVSTWMEGPPGCDEKRLLGRILPEGFLPYLAVPPLSDVELEQLDAMERGGIEAGGNEERVMSIPGAEQGGTNVDRLRGRIQRASAQGTGAADGNPPENFRIFFHVVTQDHNLPDLLWNQQTRRELRVALEGELQSIDRESLLRGGGGNVAWNHRQFAVRYPSLRDEVHVGSIYMRLWLEAGDAFIKSWENPEQLFELLFRRLLCDIDRDAIVSNMCIRCLERLYKIHSQKIGVFQDVMILVRSMALTSNIECQHRILSLLATLLGVAEDEEPQEEQEDQIHLQGNAEQLLNAEAISLLCQYTAWGHTNDAQVGNLLSEVSRVDNAYTMITDGTNRSPFSSPPTASAQAPTATGPKVWFTAPPGIIPPPAGIQGPFTIADLKAQMQTSRLYPHSLVTCSHVGDYSADASVSNTVQEHAMDTGKWRELKLVWQLRWQLCTEGTGVHGPSTVARTALRALSRLVDLHPSVNSMGVPYHPIPTAKRLLCGLGGGVEEEDDAAAGNVYLSRHDALAVVAQSLLQNDHGAVTAGAKLLYGLMLQNEEAASKLYLSGAFVFALAYTGSNFYSVAELLDVTHLCQNFQAGASAAAGATDLPLLERSILGNLLPAGLLHVLVNYGSKKFAEVFVGEYDTPEIIWTFDMRRHLVAMIQQHLGDFPQRLRENTTAKYEYCPVPGINYRRLDREIFCHNYYLHSLCDQVRFKDWPVEEPVEVFRACLENLKQELCRDQVREETAQEEARKTLRLEAGDTGDHLRKAYRKLARQYHPDKNPGGRDMFEKIKGAYELLLPVVEGGGKIQGDTREARAEEEMEDGSAEGIAGGTAALHALGLLIKTQVLLCQRYPEEIGVYKYPAYSMLLLVLQIPTNRPDCIIQTKRAEFIKSAVELMFQTCLVSPLNAEELVSEGGVPVLATLLHHFVDVLRDDNIRITLGRRGIATINVILTIITHIVHTLSGISYFEPGRTAIVSLVQQDHATFCIDWVTCISGKCWGNDIPLIKKYALEGAANLARNRTLQHALVDAGIPWPLVRCMLSYDPSLEGVAAELNETDVAQHHTSQAAANVHAQLAARALGMLCGVTKGSLAAPKNAVLYDVMVRLLTRPLAKMLRNRRPQELLRSLNANVRTPCRIWNIEMRSELLYFIDGVDGKDPPMPFTDIVTRSKDFSFDSMKGEIIIGGVYIRLFIGMGGGRQAIQEIENCQAFGKSLIKFIKKGIASYVHDKDKSAVEKKTKEHFLPVTDERFAMAVRALHQLVALDDLIDDVLCSDEHDGPAVLLSLLELPHDNEAYEISFEIIKLMAPKQRFANAVAQQGELWRLLQVLERPNPIQEEQQEVASELVQAYDRCHRRGWLVLESLASSTAIATVLAQTTGWIELLGILVGYSKFTKRLVARQGRYMKLKHPDMCGKYFHTFYLFVHRCCKNPCKPPLGPSGGSTNCSPPWLFPSSCSYQHSQK
uniref:J domain-containing protein n=1 Tax=Corethron hystrix TaxID=216773 RepID=A0A7S1BP53_9STRA|mmetsp:Transcript_35823/g.83463  ORF Transcript_35823/g.83463 Transcript_35823/m.83463 type:complete len:2212 (+) Transcript_35823:237-6872(+)